MVCMGIIMDLVVAKYGGSTIGDGGKYIPNIIKNIKQLSVDSKVMAVFSAPLVLERGESRSITDVVMWVGYNAERGIPPDLEPVRKLYDDISLMVDESLRQECQDTIKTFLSRCQDALERSYNERKFSDINRAQALGYSGELLMSCVMNYILQSNDIKSSFVPYEKWPIITSEAYEYTNFLAAESKKQLQPTLDIIKEYDVTCMGGFIGKTLTGKMSTYERGGTDRTAADMGILLQRHYNVRIVWEKNRAVASADPKMVKSGLLEVKYLSYNEARMAGMFGMKILDTMAIKDILDNDVYVPLQITDMQDSSHTTIIQRSVNNDDNHPIKIVTGLGNCAILRLRSSKFLDLQNSLEQVKRYNEFVPLSPYTKNNMWFSRILFSDGNYVRRNEEYLLKFDPTATIVYNRGAITLIGDDMWRVQHVVSKIAFQVGEAGINILNMDAQEETSRIIIIIEDFKSNLPKAIRAIHDIHQDIHFI